MRVARELGYTLSELTGKMSREELQLWCLLFEVEAQEEEEVHRKAKRR
jgi:hypothetical protein|tara:strand:- start:1164 stop:1307 length:144 start_codon:yes stop_codon:yes gene_type:complete